jgi:hypothetical protein
LQNNDQNQHDRNHPVHCPSLLEAHGAGLMEVPHFNQKAVLMNKAKRKQ